MATERPNPRDIDTRIESLDEPMGSIEFGPRRAATPPTNPEVTGEDQKPASSSYIAGSENAAVRRAEERRSRPRWSWRGLWRRLRGRPA